MDAFLPFIQRIPATPTEPDARQVVPVFRDARLTPIKEKEQRFLILRRPFKRGQNQTDYPAAPYTTPEEEQKVGADGHLDIYV